MYGILGKHLSKRPIQVFSLSSGRLQFSATARSDDKVEYRPSLRIASLLTLRSRDARILPNPPHNAFADTAR